MANDMNQNNLSSERVQQMVELQSPPVSSQPMDSSSSNYSQQHQQVEDEVTINIQKMIQDCGDGLLLSDCCIYRVPITLRHMKEEAYTPQVVSIGPFHYGDERLQDMERHKHILFKRFTQRAVANLNNLIRCVKDLEPKVRASYSETINLTKQQLVELTLIDAGFIIQLFIMFAQVWELPKDAKLSKPWFESSIRKDLLLLENQLPFFVIEELFNVAFPHGCRGNLPSFLRLTYHYFGYYNTQKSEPNSDYVKIKHFTDLLRLFHLQGKMPQQLHFSKEVGSHVLLYNANELQNAGIKLKASESKCLLNLKLSGRTLEIPQIEVQDRTELLFRNIIALEQCHYPFDACISNYAIVLDSLIDTYKDVDLLIHNKIVRNYGADTKRVASLFNDLIGGVLQGTFNSEYLDICKMLNAYCENTRHKTKATLRRDYCGTPWQTVASIAAIVLLFLTVVQTIFSILQVVK